MQLLRLNREVHGEVLPMIRDVEIQLHSHSRYDRLWPMFAVAMQSPALGVLHYTCDVNSQYGERSHVYFLPKLLVHDSPNSLDCLSITVPKVTASTRIVVGLTQPDMILPHVGMFLNTR